MIKKRFKDRDFQLRDLVHRFEAVPNSTHAHSAIAAIERLKCEGQKFLDTGSNQLNKWQKDCDVLSTFINVELGKRKYLKKEKLETALREFIAEFEHATHRMFQIMYGTFDNAKDSEDIMRMFNWFDLIYKLSTYAIISFWIDEKADKKVIIIRMNGTTGDDTEECIYEKMSNPKNKRHKLGMKNL